MNLWREDGRYRGETAEIIVRLIEACEAESGAGHPGIKILISAMVWLSIEPRDNYHDLQRGGALRFHRSSVADWEADRRGKGVLHRWAHSLRQGDRAWHDGGIDTSLFEREEEWELLDAIAQMHVANREAMHG